MCGDCCEDIYLTTSKRRLRELLTEDTATEDNRANARFVLAHWHGGVRAGKGATHHWACDAFDAETRLCTAHDDRPPICSGYPWYGNEPRVTVGLLEPRCTYVTRTRVELRRKAA